jgi:hypothetical protein
MSTPSTRNLLAKTFCFKRQSRWDAEDGLDSFISSGTIEHLEAQLHKRPIAEVSRAAKELGIAMDMSYEC